MIDYDTYKRRFGTKDTRSNTYHVSIPENIYKFLSRDNIFGIAFSNEITLALMEDTLVDIATCLSNNDKDQTLKSYKKIGDKIKKVLVKYKDDDNALNDRYYEIAPSPEEKDFFVNNPIVTSEGDITRNVAVILTELVKFYRAINTNVGNAVYKALIDERENSLETMYSNTSKNGVSSYYLVLSRMISIWDRRIAMYESYSKSLKLINGGIRNGRRAESRR